MNFPFPFFPYFILSVSFVCFLFVRLIDFFVTCTKHRNLPSLTKYKMREWYNLSVYLLLPALDACSAKPRLWKVLKEAYICLIVAVRAVSGYKPASALDQVRLYY
jgi:hypothetical protein